MIDCDVHNDWHSAEVLLPYLDRNFRDYMERGELPGGRGTFPKSTRTPKGTYAPTLRSNTVCRPAQIMG